MLQVNSIFFYIVLVISIIAVIKSVYKFIIRLIAATMLAKFEEQREEMRNQVHHATINPCLHCGEDAGVVYTEELPDGNVGYYVGCVRCGCRTAVFQRADDALEIWNLDRGKSNTEWVIGNGQG